MGCKDLILLLLSYPLQVSFINICASLGISSFPIWTIDWSHDDRLVAGAGEDLFVDVLDPHTGSSVYKIPTRGPSNCLTFNPKKALLCFACDEVSHPSNASRKSIHVIDLSTEDAPAR